MTEDQIKPQPRRLLIRGGTLIDGTGAAPRQGDVLVVGDRIEQIGDLDPAKTEGLEVVDATGLVVAPGFINILSHAYDSIQEDPRAASNVLQGVTTEIFGEGLSPGPVRGRISEHFPVSDASQTVRPFWPSLKEFLAHLELSGVAVNVASFVGFANLRLAVAGYDGHEACPSQRRHHRQRRRLHRGTRWTRSPP